jgi:hypothetical protein
MPPLPDLKLKPDFSKTVERFRAWWAGGALDRPLVTVEVKPSRPLRTRPSQHATLRDRWMDVDWNVENAIARLEAHDYPGDSLPFYMPNLGPEITATLFGCELEFGESTAWSKPVIHDPSGWERIAAAKPDFGNPYWTVLEKMTRRAMDRSEGRYMVGLTDLHGNYDILAALRDPQALCTDMLDCPDLVRKAGRRVAEAFVEALQRNWALVSGAGYGCTTWLPFHHEGLAYASSSDFWGLVSYAMARQMVLPDILVELAPLERSIFHLDGPSALQHLDLLLDLRQVQAIQWVYGAGNGPAARWIGVYRRVLAAGKAVQVIAEDPADALEILRAVGPDGVWLWVAKPFDTLDEAHRFIAETAKVTKKLPSS